MTKNSLEAAIKELRKGSKSNFWQVQKKTYQSLNKYAKNFNELVAEGKLDPVIGRDEEIRRVLTNFIKKNQNNPILIGEPGVGKTTMQKELLKQNYFRKRSENLKTKPFIHIDMGALIAGAKYKENLKRLKSVVKMKSSKVTDKSFSSSMKSTH